MVLEPFKKKKAVTVKFIIDDCPYTQGGKDTLNEVLLEILRKRLKLRRQLKEFPNGFPYSNQQECDICRTKLDTIIGWYSRLGITCIYCRDAYISGVLPSYLPVHLHSFYSIPELHSLFGIGKAQLASYILKGILNPRIIPKPDGSVHSYVFMKGENPRLRDPENPIVKSIKRHRKKTMKYRIIKQSKSKTIYL